MQYEVLKRSLLVGLMALSFTACGDDDDDNTPPNPTATKSIAQIASEDARFTTLVSALQATGLDATLSASGSFTVFAPTNDAFALLPEGVVAGLDNATLKTILQYHVIAGSAVRSSAITDTSTPTTVQGGQLKFRKEGSSIIVNGVVQITQADIAASNGVIHVIDAVLLPIAFPGNIVQAVSAYPRLKTLKDAVVAAQLAPVLSNSAAVTVFAPTNPAFAALPAGTLTSLLEPANLGTLQQVLEYHVIGSSLTASAIVGAANANGLGEATLPTLIGTRVKAVVSASGVMVNDANVIYTDIATSNGTLHVIDKVLTIPGDIVAVATAAGSFTTLLQASTTAGLVPTLQSDNDGAGFTVFAPTDAAFAALASVPTGTDLTNTLLYHVLGSQVDANAAIAVATSGTPTATTLTGFSNKTVALSLSNGSLFLNGTTRIVTTDVIAKNGIIHVIDAVLSPINN